MEIKYLGHSCFRLKGKNAIIVTDPFDEKGVGFSLSKTTADAVTISHEHADHNALDKVDGTPVIVRGPGEYEIKEVRVYGYKTHHDANEGADRGVNTVYLIVIDEIRILHCGDLGHELSDQTMEAIGDVDVLLVPVGGHVTINAKQATSLVKKIEPHIVIPMHFKTDKHTATYDELQEVDIFIKELDKTAEHADKLAVTREKLPQDLQLVVLKS